MQYFLAIDIGASSGRHILSHLKNGILQTEEIHRFENRLVERDGALYWDTEALLAEIIRGLKSCKALGKIPVSLGIDTWGVDYVLIDAAGKPLAEAYAYRDLRTKGMDDLVHAVISETDLYKRGGIQKMPFNTIYQLKADQVLRPEVLAKADKMLLMPSYFNYCLSGNTVNEYTHASTTALLDVCSRDWDWPLIDLLGYPRHIFTEIKQPGHLVGRLLPAIQEAVGFDCEVLLPPAHDTASAYLAVPARDDHAVYLSSGTWSLLGIESREPILSPEASEAQFTNEGAYGDRYRFLKNIMGLWMIQSIRRELTIKPSYQEMEAAAREAADFNSIVDVNDARFMAPKSMIETVKTVCRENGQPVPESLGELLTCVYRSLAVFYAASIKRLEQITGRQFTSINIVGGGSMNTFLNELTAQTCGLPVFAGPSEGTVIGNLLSQMLAKGLIENVEEARDLVRKSFDIKTF